jgi:F-type H+/Na+-transporting ATPase subunit alpha
VGIVVMGDYTTIEVGDQVRATGNIASMPVGDALIGRVVDPLGNPIDGKGPLNTTSAARCNAPPPALLSAKVWIRRCRPASCPSTRCSPSAAASAS